MRRDSDGVSSPGLEIALLVLAIFLTFLAARLPPGSMWARGDLFPLWPTADRIRFDLFTWDVVEGGTPAIWAAYLIAGAFWWVGHVLGLATATLQVIEEAAYHAAAAGAGAYLASRLFPGRRLLPLGAAVFYTFNFDWIINPSNALLDLRVFVPLWLGLYLDFCRAVDAGMAARARWLGLAFAVAASVGASYATINLPQLIVAATGVTMIMALRALAPGGRRRRMVATLALLAATGAACAWWISVAVTYYLVSISLIPGASIGTTIDPVQWSWTHARDSFLNLFQLNSAWGWRSDYFAFISFYSAAWLRVLAFVPLVLAVAALPLARAHGDRARVLVLVAGLCALLFISKGLHEPWSGVNLWLYRHMPLMWLLREPNAKLSIFITLIASVLAGFSLEQLKVLLHRAGAGSLLLKAVVAALMVACAAPAFPLLSSQLIQSGTQLMPNGYVRIPQYWLDLAQYFTERPGARVLLLPSNNFYQVPYTWGLYGAEFLPDRLAPVGVVRRSFGYLNLVPGYSRQVDDLYARLEDTTPRSDVEGADPVEALVLLRRLGIEYLLVRNDAADPQARPLGSPVPDPRLEGIHRRLAELGLQPEQSFGALDLYRVPDEWVRPHIFAARISHTSSAPPPVAGDGAQPSKLVNAGPLAITLETPTGASIPIKVQGPQAVVYQRINPTAYRVRIEGAQQPVLVVLEESFHPLWEAHLVEQRCCGAWWNTAGSSGLDFAELGVHELPGTALFLPRSVFSQWRAPAVPAESHLVADGYANAWLIDAQGDYELLLEYAPQRWFYLGLLTTFASLIAGTAYTMHGWRRAHRPARLHIPRISPDHRRQVLWFLAALLLETLLVALAQHPLAGLSALLTGLGIALSGGMVLGLLIDPTGNRSTGNISNIRRPISHTTDGDLRSSG